jgi:hypothetical protein
MHIPVILPSIVIIVNLAIRDGMPLLYKNSCITPLLKKKGADIDNLANYRPIANLHFLSKVIERALFSQIVDHLETNLLIDSCQSAYRNHHSCETAILSVLNVAYLAMDRQEVTLLVLLDLSSAFDSVDHLILAQRLRACGIVDQAHCWIMNYLSNRTQFVSITGCKSSTLDVTCGVPQGSVLGPLLFLIYLNGIHDVIAPFDMHYALYADDLQLFVSSPVSLLSITIFRLQSCVLAVKS